MKHADSNTNISYLISKVREFLEERDWKKYQNPKDLAESICIEAAELLQLFQWTKPEESEQFKNKLSEVQRIKEELADVVICCLSMADTLNIDLTNAILDKLEQNKKKYPAELCKGKAYLTLIEDVCKTISLVHKSFKLKNVLVFLGCLRRRPALHA